MILTKILLGSSIVDTYPIETLYDEKIAAIVKLNKAINDDFRILIFYNSSQIIFK